MITNILQVKKEEVDKNMVLVSYLLKILNIIHLRKKVKKKEETITERVKLRRQKANDEDLSDMPPLEGDEEVKEGKGLKILTPNKLLPRFPVLLVQVKAGSNSYKLKNDIRQILYLLYQHNKITKKVYNI